MHNEWADQFTDEELFFMINRFLFYIMNNENTNKDNTTNDISKNELFNGSRK